MNHLRTLLSEYLAELLEDTVKLAIDVGHKLYTQSSVIVLSAGTAAAVHYFASQNHPILKASIDATFHGSVALAKYVGLAFLLKAALTPVHMHFMGGYEKFPSELDERKSYINSHVVRYLTPVALTWIVAYTIGIPVKSVEATLYTLGTFGLMKILDKGYEYALSKPHTFRRDPS
jgi:hypothetical protein